MKVVPVSDDPHFISAYGCAAQDTPKGFDSLWCTAACRAMSCREDSFRPSFFFSLRSSLQEQPEGRVSDGNPEC